MTAFPSTLFAGRRYAVVGLGKNGLPAAEALLAMGAHVTAWDDSKAARAAAPHIESRDLREGDLNFDAVLLSPGIPHRLPKPHPIAARAISAGVPIVSDVELLFQAVRRSGSRARFVGITGTNGKSTTTALLAHVLKQAGWNVAAGANLGPAALSLPLLPDDGVYVLEMSSYMLERLDQVRFDAAAMLNLSPDHIERHGDMAGYASAKRAIFDRQTDADLAVIGIDDACSRAMAAALDTRPAKVVRVSGLGPRDMSGLGPRDMSGLGPRDMPGAGPRGVSHPSRCGVSDPSLPGSSDKDSRYHFSSDLSLSESLPADVFCLDGVLRDAAGPILRMADAIALPGAHNAQNAGAAATIAEFLGLGRENIASGIASYPGLPHRQQRIVAVDGVTFVNDSKATNADAAERALVCYDRLIWIAGGMAKEGGIVPLIPLFPRVARAILIGRDAPVFAETLATHRVPFDMVETLDKAVPAAFAAAKREHAAVVLLSPAAASWDQFRSYEHRGERFAELARGLAAEPRSPMTETFQARSAPSSASPASASPASASPASASPSSGNPASGAPASGAPASASPSSASPAAAGGAR